MGVVIVCILTTYAEKSLLLSLDSCATREHYLSSTFLSISIFLLALTYKSASKSLFSEMGEKDSLYIYIFHPLFISLCNALFIKIHMQAIYLWVAPIIVLITTMVFVKCIRKLKFVK